MGSSPETRELAYTIWREHGQNIVETVRVMNSEHGYVISRQSVTTWAAKYGWHDRAARAEAEEKALDQSTAVDSLLAFSLKQKKKYEEYFETLSVGQIDNGAVYAYNSILKTILEIRDKTDAGLTVETPGPADTRTINTPQDAVAALKEAVERKLNAMLASPDSINMRSVQETEKALALIEKMQTKYRTETAKKETATDEDKKRLINEVDKILGVK